MTRPLIQGLQSALFACAINISVRVSFSEAATQSVLSKQVSERKTEIRIGICYFDINQMLNPLNCWTGYLLWHDVIEKVKAMLYLITRHIWMCICYPSTNTIIVQWLFSSCISSLRKTNFYMYSNNLQYYACHLHIHTRFKVYFSNLLSLTTTTVLTEKAKH